MLDELRIRGLGVIDDAVLPLGPGLTAVTGETGAGKTMVVTGLLLLFGGRADAARVRTGAEQASVEGRLTDVARSVVDRVRDAGGEVDDAPDGGADLALRRVVSAAGRSRAFVGGASAPVAVLGELAEQLVVVHGQADQLRLTHRGEQLDLLDRYGEIDRDDYQAAYLTWRAAAAALAERTSRASELSREADLLSHGVAEIEAAAPQSGEDLALSERIARLTHADGLQAAAHLAHDALAGDGEPASEAADVASLLAAARRAMGQAAGADPALDKLAGQLEDLTAAALDLAAELRDYEDALDADPQQLDAVQQRRSVLAALIRRYGEDDVDSVLRWAESAGRRLTELDVSDEAIAALTAERDRASHEAGRLADELSAARTAAAARLSAAVTAELAGLAMAGASVTVVVRRRAPTAATPRLSTREGECGAGTDGVDDVEFLLQPHRASPVVPIARGASGGELSRVMLALEVCLAGADPVPTMVFDEVDAGVGGRAAVEVGRRLARLARSHQVIVVTHLAQVAAYADRHIVVDKPADVAAGAVTASDVRLVTDADRVAELARMLAGSGTSTAREHAGELLAEAGRDRDALASPPKPPRARAAKTTKASKTAS